MTDKSQPRISETTRVKPADLVAEAKATLRFWEKVAFYVFIGALALSVPIVTYEWYSGTTTKVADSSGSGETSSVVTAECPGGPESVTPGTNWLDLKNREKKCRIVARVKTGRVIFKGSAGETPPVGPEGGRWRDMIYYDVRGTTGSDEITIARCPQSTAHTQNIGWDCKSLKS